MKRKIDFKQIVYLILIALLIVFVVQNLDSARVKFFTFGFELPLIILIAIVFFLGFFSAKIFKKEPVKDKKEVDSSEQDDMDDEVKEGARGKV